MENMRRPLDHHLKNLLARSHDGFVGEPFKGFHAAVFIPTGAGTASAVFLKFG